ncbi:hypothetical protein [Burkholderia ambifaria]|uniref:hypothetical protein n=1 Tax=Burkholderia ambifaria TaxID=152480 RepID=UPI00158F32C5|nr:hypothetical protein [Burkholderia ambifaria]
MPTFTFTSPDGKIYDVQGPDGATKEQAFSILQQRLGAGGSAAPTVSGPVAPLDRLPPDSPATGMTPSPHADTIAERLLGLGKSAVGLGEAGLSAATGALAAPVGAAYGIGKTLTSGKYGTQQGIEAGERAGAALASKLTYQPRTEAGRSDVEALGNLLSASRLEGMAPDLAAMRALHTPQVPRPPVPESVVKAATRAGNIVPPAATNPVGAVGSLVQPFTQGGRERIVGGLLNTMATDPLAARTNLGAAESILKGSSPTAAQAARDYGLLGLEKVVKGESPKSAARFASEAAEPANLARTQALGMLAGTEKTLTAAKTARSTAADALYKAADATLVPVDKDFRELASRPAIKAAISAAQRAAKNSGDRLTPGRDIPGGKTPQLPAPGEIPAPPGGAAQVSGKGLHYIKKALDDQIERASSAQSGTFGKLNLKSLKDAREDFLKWTDDRIPEYAKARAEWRRMTPRVARQELLQDLQKQVFTQGTDLAGNRIMSRAKFRNAVERARPELQENLSPAQMRFLDKIAADLDRGALSDANLTRPAGSDTFQNLSAANIVGSIINKKLPETAIGKTIARPLEWLYKIPDERMRELLVDAMLDPKIASRLMRKATPKNMKALSLDMQNFNERDFIPWAAGAQDHNQ